MTGPEHYDRAEQLLEMAGDDGMGSDAERYHIEAAQVHATLALAAACALGARDGGMPKMDYAEWRQAAGQQTEAEAGHERIGGQP